MRASVVYKSSQPRQHYYLFLIEVVWLEVWSIMEHSNFFFFNRLLVELLISFPKVLVAAVNGIALGFGTALLSLCDIVYASNKVC